MSVPEGKILLSVVSPERKVLEEAVDECVLPGAEGYFGVLPGHAPLLTALKAGQIEYREGGRWRHLFAHGGFVEVLPNRVSVLADVCERADEIDVERAAAARERAEKRLKSGDPDVDWDRARAALERAVGRIQVAGRK